ncbi:MAG: PAS domain-containing protein, partial [Methanomassiliicoccales archaeon]
MKKGSPEKDDAALLRQRAEKVAGEIPQESDLGLDLIRANHELRVHQIELEMQNGQLHHSQLELEASRDRYHDLYEFAPLGYFTLDAELQIREVNLTGAGLLGRTRPELEGNAFQDLIDLQDLHVWARHVDVVRRGLGGDCEIALHRPDGKLVHARIHSVMMPREERGESMRMAISDVGARWAAEKKAQESGRKLEMMASITHHDLLNQVIILRGFLELAKRREDAGEVEELRRKADTAAKNLEAIINFTNVYQELGKQEPVWTE